MNIATPKKSRSVAGNAQGAGLWELESFDLDRLRQDLATAINGWDWSRGCFGHSLPLTRQRLSSFGAAHYNNLIKGADEQPESELSDKLDACPYFRKIFQDFQCEKSSFRILRRPARSSYTLHRDSDMGTETFRFQIPIECNADVRLLVSTTNRGEDFLLPSVDYRKVEDWDAEGIDSDSMRSWFTEFVLLNDDKVRIYRTEPGKLYYFSMPTNYHNLMNFGDMDRFTLAMDLVANEWLYERYPFIRSN
jgi:hypothetical protein